MQEFVHELKGKSIGKSSNLGTLYGNNPYWKQMDFEIYHSKKYDEDISFADFEDYAQIEKNLRIARNKYMEEHGMEFSLL